jgi:TetR/AcrR family transcriptional repressor of nem operon
MNIKHNREDVLRKGLKLFCTDGYNSLGVDLICKETGMTKGAFYNAYKSKESFLLACLELYSHENTKRIIGKLSNSANLSAKDRLTLFYEEMIEAQPKNSYTGCVVNNIMSELGGSNTLVSEATNLYFNNFLAPITEAVAEAQKEGTLTPNIQANEIAELLHVAFYGILTRIKASNNVDLGLKTMHTLINSLNKH